MSVQELVLPTARVTVALPDDALAALRVLFPGVRAAARGDRPSSDRFVLAPDGDVWRLEVEGASLGRFASAAHGLLALEHRILGGVGRSRAGRIVFHAGAVDLGGTACLLAGPPEAGKTSCTVQLVELGATFVADEVAIVEADPGVVHPLARTAAVASGFVDRALGERLPRGGRLVELAPSVWRYVPERMASAPVEVSHLVLPRFRHGAELAIERLDAGEALTEVLGTCFEPAGETERLVDDLIALLERWSVHRLSYGDAAAARRGLGELFPAFAAAESA